MHSQKKKKAQHIGKVVITTNFLTLYPYLTQVGDTEEKANGIQDVGLSRTIKPCDGIEEWVKAIDFSALAIALEAINYH